MAIKPCERVGLDFVDSAPYRFVSTLDLAITPEQLFEVLADAESWPQWAWEPFSHIAFRFNEASTGSIAAFAEDYRVVPTSRGCHLTLVMAMKPNGVAGRLGTAVGRPVMARVFQKFLYNLRGYTDKRYASG